MKMVALMKRARVTPNYVVYESGEADVYMTYLRRHGLSENRFPELVTVEVTLHEPEVVPFRDFLTDNVEAHDPGRLTISDIWNAWATHCGADPADKLVEGIRLQDVASLFRGCFGAPEQVRARVGERVQRCWTGYRMTQRPGSSDVLERVGLGEM